jgi:hypothetical protein
VFSLACAPPKWPRAKEQQRTYANKEVESRGILVLVQKTCRGANGCTGGNVLLTMPLDVAHCAP